MELDVALGSRRYPIVIEPGLLQRDPLERVRRQCGGTRIHVVTDTNVAVHYAACFAGEDAVVLPAGEATKCFAQFQELSETLLQRGVDRGSILVALGGGVVGDLVGFVAATLLRGIAYVQVPTTLLAQVDSSVGGKTAIDTPQGKNLVGAFHQPRLVLIDPETLKTLPTRQMHAGYAEVVKYGLIRDREFFEWLGVNGGQLLAGAIDRQEYAIEASCRAKAGVVAADETEKGERALLNFGHTFAHAIEAVNNFDESILHGEAVAAGMCLAFRLSEKLGLCAANDRAQVEAHFEACGLPRRLSDFPQLPRTPEAYLKAMQADKKTFASRLVFILARGIGEAFVADDVAADAVRDVLAQSFTD